MHFCSPVSGDSRSNSMTPISPLIGERISWLIIARKSDLLRLDRSASSQAMRSASSVSCRLVMTVKVSTEPPAGSDRATISTILPLGNRCSETAPIPSCEPDTGKAAVSAGPDSNAPPSASVRSTSF